VPGLPLRRTYEVARAHAAYGADPRATDIYAVRCTAHDDPNCRRPSVRMRPTGATANAVVHYAALV
jgi:hypothetical protein